MDLVETTETVTKKTVQAQKEAPCAVQPLGRVARKRKARQQKMLLIALGIVEEGGVDALTIKEIAARMDLVMGAIYRYFPSKQELLEAMQSQALQQLQESFSTVYREVDAWYVSVALEGEDAALLHVLRVLAAAQTYFSFHRHHQGHARILDALLSSPESLLRDRVASEAQLLLILGAVAKDLAFALDQDSEGCLRHAHVMWATLHGLGHFRKRDAGLPTSLQARELQPFATRGLLLGWGVAPATLGRAEQLLAQFTTH